MRKTQAVSILFIIILISGIVYLLYQNEELRQQLSKTQSKFEVKGLTWVPSLEIGIDLLSPPMGTVTLEDHKGIQIFSDTYPSQVYDLNPGKYILTTKLAVYLAGDKLFFREWQSQNQTVLSMNPKYEFLFVPNISPSVLWAVFVPWNVEIKVGTPIGELSPDIKFKVHMSESGMTIDYQTPANVEVTEGEAFTVVAPQSFLHDGVRYQFLQWKDDWKGEILSNSTQITLAADRFFMIWAEFV